MSTIANDAASPRARRTDLVRRRGGDTGVTGRMTVSAPVSGPRRPLSPGQSRAWFLHTREPHSSSLNIGVAYRLSGALDVTRLRTAVATVVAEHDMLRTSYGLGIDGEAYQVVRPDLSPSWREHDLSGRSAAGLARRVEVLVRRELGRPFDLSADAPLRLSLIRTGGDEFVLVLVAHTIAWDDESLSVFTAQLEAAYNVSAPAHRAPTRFSDAAIRRADDSVALDYWRRTLTPLPDLLELPGGPVADAAGSAAECHGRALPPALVERVRAYAGAHDSTPTAVLFAAYSALIHRYTAATDFLVAMPVTLRDSDPGTHIGYYGNTLLLRATPRTDCAFADFAEAVTASCARAFAHKHTGIDRVVHAINPDRTGSRDGLEHLVQVGFGVRGSGSGFALDGVTATKLELGGPRLPVPLRFTVTLDPAAPRIDIEYRPGRLDAELAAQMLGHYLQLLDSALACPQQHLGELDMFGPDGRARLLAVSRGEQVETVPDTLVSLFERRVTAAPDAVAVIAPAERPASDLELTYAELNRRANRLAHWLINAGIGTEDIVALRIPNSVEFVVAVLAVLKSGAAYLPVDPAYPDERIEHLVADAKPRLVLGRVELAAAEESALARPHHDPADGDRVRPLHPDNLAYIIYTSGSTGTPKGVPVAHAAIADHLIGFGAQWGMTADDRLLQSSSVSFDASLLDIFLTLALGARLVIPRQDAFRDIGYIADLISRYGVTVLHMVPSLLSTLLLLPAVSEWRALRHVPVGGEALLGEVADRFAGVFDAELRNHYGPTEAVVSATHMPVEGPQGTRIVPVGVPNRNVCAYLLDERLRLVPAGVVGEIYLGGDQLARGYLGLRGQTAERFVADPFDPGKRLYRTGDLARRNSAGELEFVGRADEQVKVRGYRIELGEVQAAIAGHPGVAHCVVVATADRALGVTLAAYVVPAGSALDLDDVRDHAANSLPEFMIPSAFAQVDRIPLTEHGKLDKRALPEPRRVGARTRTELATVTEVRLAALFGEIFGRDEVGADDSFFELGGHSLLANQLVVRIRAEFGVEIDVRAPFDTPTVAGLAALIESTPVTIGPNGLPPLTKHQRPERIPLSQAQRAEWVMGATGVVEAAVRLTGPVDEAVLTAALGDVIGRHAALRTVFPSEDGEPRQSIQPVAEVRLPVTTVDEGGLAAALADARDHHFDLASGPLLAARLFLLDDGARVLSLLAHRLVADDPSLRTVISDLAIAYGCRITSGHPPQWGVPAIDHADFTLWQAAAADIVGLRDPHRVEQEPPASAGLTVDRPDSGTSAGAHTVTFGIPSGLRRRLEARAEACGASDFMLYQAAVTALLFRLGAGTDIVIEIPDSGRTDAAATDLVGPLAGMRRLHTDLSGDPSLADVLDRARDAALGALRNGDLLTDSRPGPATSLPQAVIRCDSADGIGAAWLTDDVHMTLLPAAPVARRALTFVFTPSGDGEVDAGVIADAGRYEPATAGMIARYLLNVLEQFADLPERGVGELRLMTSAEQERVLGEWSTGVEPSDLRGLAAVFRHGRAVPGVRIALRHGAQMLSFGELFQRLDDHAAGTRASNESELDRLIGMLAELAPQPTAPVAVGVLGAGSARPELDRQITVPIPEVTVGPLTLSTLALTAAVADRRSVAADRRCAGSDPARRRPDVRLFALHPGDAQLGADLLAALTDGATLILATEAQRTDPAALAEVVIEHAVTQVIASPRLLADLAASDIELLPTVHRWDVTGIGWTPGISERLRELAPASVATFAYRASGYLGAVARGPLRDTGRARPVPGAKILLLDDQMRPVAPGVLGDVYIGGIALASEFTRGAAVCVFVDDPFEPGQRLLRTGDSARWTADGCLAFARA
ncbi:non-ribosomal peptide synthetase [Nocardia cyriacigeorgica]|uniref:Amino acid adenylation domain-containing protein n=1 Tax=Nocardia cyriacigeorgica TaxID=135487 RepID=A0A6P1D089_9NOCA|nr:non-ribosomal peptide synthetase [Nocardia cyriacigeorgica]NEW43866.1 amino acid adenylation domain-containing protein [Nocardia cyriacigeorgica]